MRKTHASRRYMTDYKISLTYRLCILYNTTNFKKQNVMKGQKPLTKPIGREPPEGARRARQLMVNSPLSGQLKPEGA